MSEPDVPMISVITPCLNRVQFVAEAVESVLAQNYPNFEHIVMDGGSTDGTLTELARYPHLRVFSEPDESLYDAVNKGIRRAHGDVIAWLNTDDLFAPGVFAEVGRAFAADSALDAVFGRSAIFRERADGSRAVSAVTSEVEMLFSPRRATLRPISINARFFHRRVYDRVGLYDPTYRIAGDREFYLRAFLSASIRSRFLDRMVCLYRHHAGSLTFNDSNYSAKAALEHVRMAEALLRNSREFERGHSSLRVLHTYETLGLVAYEIRRARWWAATQFAIRGWSFNPCWPVEFSLASLRWMLGQRTTLPM